MPVTIINSGSSSGGGLSGGGTQFAYFTEKLQNQPYDYMEYDASGNMLWASNNNGTRYPQLFNYDELYHIHDASLKPGLWHIMSNGQSLSYGNHFGASISNTQRFDDVMLGNTVHSVQQGGRVGSAPLREQDGIVTKRGESPVTGALDMMSSLYNRRGLVIPKKLGSNVGLGGQSLLDLSPSTKDTFWRQLVHEVQQGKNEAENLGLAYTHVADFWIHGENDNSQGTTHDQYVSQYADYKRIKTEHITRVSGQNFVTPTFHVQCCNQKLYSQQFSTSGRAQATICTLSPHDYMVGPNYMYQRVGTSEGGSDYLHLDPFGSLHMGLNIGVALFYVIALKQDWRPVQPRRVVFNASSTVLDIDTMFGDINLRTDLVADTPGKGFEIEDAAGNVIYPSGTNGANNDLGVTASGKTITLDKGVPVGGKVTYAHFRTRPTGTQDGPGNGGQVCDSMHLLFPNLTISGTPVLLSNYMLQCAITNKGY